MGQRTLKRSSLKQWNRKREESESEDRGMAISKLDFKGNFRLRQKANSIKNSYFLIHLPVAMDIERIFNGTEV